MSIDQAGSTIGHDRSVNSGHELLKSNVNDDRQPNFIVLDVNQAFSFEKLTLEKLALAFTITSKNIGR